MSFLLFVRFNLIFCLFIALANVWAIINACENLGKPDGQTVKNWLSLVFFALMFVFLHIQHTKITSSSKRINFAESAMTDL